jgi:hypothetical protein
LTNKYYKYISTFIFKVPKLEANRQYPNHELFEAHRQSTMGMMSGIKQDLIANQLTTQQAVIHKGWDIHCFFPRIEDPGKIIHCQLFIRPNRGSTIEIKIREMDKEKIKAARKLTSVGNEETAVTKHIQKRAPVLCTHDMIYELLKQVLQK